MILGYARVSKAEEHDPRMQEEALRAAGAERVFAEQASGGRWERPALHRMLDQLRADDVVVVWKLGVFAYPPSCRAPHEGGYAEKAILGGTRRDVGIAYTGRKGTSSVKEGRA